MTGSHQPTKHRISYIAVGGGDQPIVDHFDALSVEGWEPFHLHEVEVDGRTKIMVVSRRGMDWPML